MAETGSEITVYRYPADIIAGWKSYPVRILGPRPSKCHSRDCHGQPTVLVHSMAGGFVSANCSTCGAKDTFSEDEFLNLALWVSCPFCRRQMEPRMLSRVAGIKKLAGNYGYVCFPCSRYTLLADMLPSWEDLVLPVVEEIRVSSEFEADF